MSRPLAIHVGEVFGYWRVIYVPGHSGLALCQCRCLRIMPCHVYRLRNGRTRSCACSKGEGALTHGHTSKFQRVTVGVFSPTYMSYVSMMSRCTQGPYADQGISVCERWRQSYQAFLDDVGEGPSRGHSLDRYPDQCGNYEPGNVRWATAKEQSRNTRSNHVIEWRGEKHCVTEWADVLDMPVDRLRTRIKYYRQGLWSLDRVFTEPNLRVKKV